MGGSRVWWSTREKKKKTSVCLKNTQLNSDTVCIDLGRRIWYNKTFPWYWTCVWYHHHYIPPVPVLVNEEHSEVVGEGSKDSFVGFEEDISYSDRAVAQEAKLPLSVKLLQQDKTMVGQLHSSTCTKAHRHTHVAMSFLSGRRPEFIVTTKSQADGGNPTTLQRVILKESFLDAGDILLRY